MMFDVFMGHIITTEQCRSYDNFNENNSDHRCLPGQTQKDSLLILQTEGCEERKQL